MARPVWAVAFLASTGCSWLGMTRPPQPPIDPSSPVTCTTSRAAPILDTTAAVLVGGASVAVTAWGIANPAKSGPCSWLSTNSSCSFFAFESGAQKAAVIAGGLVGVGFAVMEAFSAADGFRWASTCDDLRGLQLSCVSGVEASCADLRRPPPAPRKDPGAICAADDECREGYRCYLQRCQPR